MYSIVSSIRTRLIGTYHNHTYRAPTTVATRKNHFIRPAGSPLSARCQKPGERNSVAVTNAQPAIHSGGNANFMRTVSADERVRGVIELLSTRACHASPAGDPHAGCTRSGACAS